MFPGRKERNEIVPESNLVPIGSFNLHPGSGSVPNRKSRGICSRFQIFPWGSKKLAVISPVSCLK